MTNMTQQVKSLFDTVANSMASGDVERLASHFAMPFVVYLLDEIIVSHTHQELCEMISLRMKTALTSDVDRITAKIIDTEENGGGRATVIVQWTFLNKDDEILRSNLIRYMVSQRRQLNGLHIEISEYLWVSDTPLAKYTIEKLKTRQPAWRRWH